MFAESNVHGSPLTILLCLIIIYPAFRFLWLCFHTYRTGKFKQPRWARDGKSQPLREEQAGYVEAKLERFQGRSK